MLQRLFVSISCFTAIGVATVGIGTSAMAPPSSTCASISDSKKGEIVKYVREKYKIPDSVVITIASDNLVPQSCFHELTFKGTSNLKTWNLTLYLSPDSRYLASELLDTTRDPKEEERLQMHALMDGLAQNKGASSGPAEAPVTIVEFSDFQCPYCRRFAEILKEVLPTEEGKVRIVFHHMPLTMHKWARTAAQGAACAQLQSSGAFWAFHDQLFDHQGEISEQNVTVELAKISKSIAGLDVTSFQNCMENDMSLGLVFKDMDLAASNQVNATPTLFVNGRRVQGVKDAAQLKELIKEAQSQVSTEANEGSKGRIQGQPTLGELNGSAIVSR